MTDKEKIRAEIKRRVEMYRNTEHRIDPNRIDEDECLLAFIDSLSEENIRAQWKWIDPKYEYPLCLTREMDEYGDWHYSLSSGKISETCQYISLAQLERLPDEPVDADAAMKELDEKIKLTKEHGSWKGVDVDKYMDEVRGRESDDLEEAAENYIAPIENDKGLNYINFNGRDIKDAFIAGAEWQEKQDLRWAGEIHKNGYNLCKEQMMKDAVEGEVVKDISNKLAVTAKINLAGFKFGQKVKIIILKDDGYDK